MRKRKIYTLGGKELKKFFKENPDIADGLAGDQNHSAYLFDNRIECVTLINAKHRGYENVSIQVFIDYLKQVIKAKTTKKAVRTIRTAAAKPKVDLTAENELLRKANQELTVKLAIAKQLGDETIQDLEKRLDLAYREQEEMLKELDRNIDMMKYHCEQVRLNTGEMSMGDIYYCANMISRIMEHKFGYKPKMQEL